MKRVSPASMRATLLKLVAAGALVSLVGCASVKLPPPTANAATVQSLRAANPAPAMVGAFRLADGKPAEMDRTVGGLRGSSLAPESGSFSQQLKDELVVALRGAGLYDPASTMVISGMLTDSMVDAAIGTGKARLAARFTVDRDGRRAYDKELAVESSWESSFVGAIALPLAINQYGAQYRALIDKLIADPEFRAAAAR